MGYPSGQREQTVNLPAYAYEGSNPSPTIGFEGRVFLSGTAVLGFLVPQFWLLSYAGVAQLVEH